jgi:hypothetical protein
MMHGTHKRFKLRFSSVFVLLAVMSAKKKDECIILYSRRWFIDCSPIFDLVFAQRLHLLSARMRVSFFLLMHLVAHLPTNQVAAAAAE